MASALKSGLEYGFVARKAQKWVLYCVNRLTSLEQANVRTVVEIEVDAILAKRGEQAEAAGV
jgi:hypothetical protein